MSHEPRSSKGPFHTADHNNYPNKRTSHPNTSHGLRSSRFHIYLPVSLGICTMWTHRNDRFPSVSRWRYRPLPDTLPPHNYAPHMYSRSCHTRHGIWSRYNGCFRLCLYRYHNLRLPDRWSTHTRHMFLPRCLGACPLWTNYRRHHRRRPKQRRPRPKPPHRHRYPPSPQCSIPPFPPLSQPPSPPRSSRLPSPLPGLNPSPSCMRPESGSYMLPLNSPRPTATLERPPCLSAMSLHTTPCSLCHPAPLTISPAPVRPLMPEHPPLSHKDKWLA